MEEVIKEELTMSAVPKAVNYLIEEVAEMRAVLDHIGATLFTASLSLTQELHVMVNLLRRLVLTTQTPILPQ